MVVFMGGVKMMRVAALMIQVAGGLVGTIMMNIVLIEVGGVVGVSLEL